MTTAKTSGAAALALVIGCDTPAGAHLSDRLPPGAVRLSKRDVLERGAAAVPLEQQADFDVVYCAVQAEDDEEVARAQEALGALEGRAGKLVLVSTTLVYDRQAAEPAREWVSDPFEERASGHPAHALELHVASSRFTDFHIVRLPPALFGATVAEGGAGQAYCLDDLWRDVGAVLRTGVRVVNLVHPPPPSDADAAGCGAGVRTRYGWALFSWRGGDELYSCSREHAEARRRECERARAALQRRPWAASNLAWAAEDEPQALAHLGRLGLTRLEVSLTRYGAWGLGDLDAHRVRALRRELARRGMSVYAVQSLFHGQDEGALNLFAAPSAFIQHFVKVLDHAIALGAERVVFGSPSARFIHASKDRAHEAYLKAHDEFASVFRALGAHAAARTGGRLVVCIKACSAARGCNYLFSAGQVQAMVDAIGHPNVRACWDARAAQQEEGDGGAGGAAAYVQVDERGAARVPTGVCVSIKAASRPCDCLDDLYRSWHRLLADSADA